MQTAQNEYEAAQPVDPVPETITGGTDETDETGDAIIEWTETAPPPEGPPTSPAGRNLLVFSAVFGAVILGTLWHLGGRFLDLNFLTPLMAGIGLAFIIEKAVSRAKWRRPRTLVWLSIAATLLLFTTRYVEDSISGRAKLVSDLAQYQTETTNLPPEMARDIVEEALTPLMTLRLSMKLAAHRGIFLSPDLGATYLLSSGTRVSGIPFRGFGFWLMLALQGAVISWICAEISTSSARSGFCDPCGMWAKRHWLYRKQGHQADELAANIRTQNWYGASEIRLGGRIDARDFSSAHLLHCPQCEGRSLVVSRTQRDSESSCLFYAPVTEAVAESIRKEVRRVV